MKRRGSSLLLEILLGLALILMVVLLVASLFPSSYQASLQAARMNCAVQLSRDVLERQKHSFPALTVGNQTVEFPVTVQGRPVLCQFFYRVDKESAAGASPILWKATVQWQNAGKIKEIALVGASPAR